jgi:hypothetical protein
MDHQLKRLLGLVRRTGDRLVVTDPDGEDAYVLMGLGAYEKLADRSGLAEPETWDRPCRFEDDYYDEDFDDEEFETGPEWVIPDELSREEGGRPVFRKEKDIWGAMPRADEESETWNPEKFDDEDKKIIKEKFGNPDFSAQPSEKDDETFGEEQFYLEPVE